MNGHKKILMKENSFMRTICTALPPQVETFVSTLSDHSASDNVDESSFATSFTNALISPFTRRYYQFAPTTDSLKITFLATTLNLQFLYYALLLSALLWEALLSRLSTRPLE